ncbi:HU family DNA-binding protein [Mycoplasma iguanae]|uniref:HU family DNA-binding protein n=1 Tax=Mycoplasma iguanae TaxID=292461 RepID=A0ABY5R965_9MOLU|nr:HU family DNA-binding protein [Mycoplasma iguanae]UVD81515.1 HU family DNA-binding protein [Mycoplasma iguanae]
MTKKELVRKVAELSDLTEAKADKAIASLVEVITESLKAGEKLQVLGLGTFKVSDRKERQGINPRTKETITIAASKSVKFQAAKALKESI